MIEAEDDEEDNEASSVCDQQNLFAFRSSKFLATS